MEMGLKGKVAIVTGGSDGIGKAAAESLAREGASVVICARRPDVLEEAASDIAASTGGAVLPVQADVTRTQDIENVVNRAVERFGRVDILVNNAGASAAASFEAVDDKAWQADMDLKFYAAIRFSRLVIPHMKRVGGGRIINVTNLGGKAPRASSVPTSVSRAAGIALTKALSKDLAAYHILVNTVCIGLIESGQHRRRWERAKAQDPSLTLEAWYERLGKGVPVGRVGKAQEAGDVICFLASERASFLSGTSVNIDGGSSAVI
ncbi:MAG: SDR family oxidoreductase [Chloroflexi bacterium]|nr:SDR family oxidoreductase [Chloroflexota bacterium]